MDPFADQDITEVEELGDEATLSITIANKPADAVEEAVASISEPESLTEEVPDDEAFFASFTEASRRRLTRKIDVWLLPGLFLSYFLAQLPQSDLQYLQFEGMQDTLQLSETRWSILTACYFIGFAVAALPMTLLVLRNGLERPSYYLSSVTASWALVLLAQAWWATCLNQCICRFILGLFQAMFYPVVAHLCSIWYKPDQMALRLATVMSGGILADMLAGPLAAWAPYINPGNSVPGWRWYYSGEALVAILVSLVIMTMIPDMPQESDSWLSADEMRYLRILEAEKTEMLSPIGSACLQWKHIREVFRDWQIWAIGYLMYAAVACGNAIRLSLPNMIQSMELSKSTSLLYGVVPYISGLIVLIVVGFASDRWSARWPFIACSFTLAAIGFGGLLRVVEFAEAERVAIISCICVSGLGCATMTPLLICWTSNNVQCSNSRGVAFALILTIGSLGGLTEAFMYKESKAPEYYLGFGLSNGLAVLAFPVIVAVLFSYLNEKQCTDSSEDEAVEEDRIELIEDRAGGTVRPFGRIL